MHQSVQKGPVNPKVVCLSSYQILLYVHYHPIYVEPENTWLPSLFFARFLNRMLFIKCSSDSLSSDGFGDGVQFPEWLLEL